MAGENYPFAVYWYRKAAEHSDADTQWNLDRLAEDNKKARQKAQSTWYIARIHLYFG